MTFMHFFNVLKRYITTIFWKKEKQNMLKFYELKKNCGHVPRPPFNIISVKYPNIVLRWGKYLLKL